MASSVSIADTDLEHVAVLFGEVKSAGVFNPVQDQLLARVFDEHLRGTMAQLRLELDRVGPDTPVLRDCQVLMVRWTSPLCVCFRSLAWSCQ
jgi:hypothetical protein